MPVKAFAIGVLAVCLTHPVYAQDQMTPDQFLDRADGRTLTFRHFPNGDVVGVEQFLSRTRTVWATPTGTCTYGRVEVRKTQVCFIYDDLADPQHCWVPFTSDEGMVVVAGVGSIQRVSKITKRPVVCDDAAIS